MSVRKEKTAEAVKSNNQVNITRMEDILSILQGATREEPVRRKDLKERIHCSDRDVRDCINELRKRKNRICMKTTDGGGYWLARDEADYREFRIRYASYLKDIAETLKAMDEGPIEGQVTLDE